MTAPGRLCLLARAFFIGRFELINPMRINTRSGLAGIKFHFPFGNLS
jgi:hypothetical protein